MGVSHETTQLCNDYSYVQNAAKLVSSIDELIDKILEKRNEHFCGITPKNDRITRQENWRQTPIKHIK